MTDAATARGVRDARSRRDREQSFEQQRQWKRTTGYAGANAGLAHAVEQALLATGEFTRSDAKVAGQLVATGGDYNFQGVGRLSFWCGVSARTVRRARAKLERAGLLTSHLVHPGERVPGQKWPADRLRVVRDTRKLVQLVAGNRSYVRPHHKRDTTLLGRRGVYPPQTNPTAAPGSSAAHAPLSDEQLREIAAAAPHWLRSSILGGSRPPPPPSAPITPLSDDEIDEIERELIEQTPPTQRPPPPPPTQRPPPPRRRSRR